MHQHIIRKCECGIILLQCRCIGPKLEEIVSPCVHKEKNVKDSFQKRFDSDWDDSDLMPWEDD